MFFVVPPAQLTPLMIARSFGDEVWRLSVTEVLFSAGSVTGGIIISFWGGFKNRMRTVALGFFMFGIFTMLIGLMDSFILFLVIICVTGLSMPAVTAPAMAMLQEQVSADMQGRVFSLVQIVMTAIMPLGMVVFGPIADNVRIEYLMIITGVILAALSIATLFNKHFRRGLISS